MNYLEIIRLSVAEISLVLGALVVLGADLAMRGRPEAERRNRVLFLGLLACGVSLGLLLGMPFDGRVAGGMLVGDPLVRWVKGVLLLLTAGTLVLSARASFTQHLGEYVAVVLLGGVGMLLVAGSENVLMMFLALELASLSLYILAAFDKRSPAGTEAALKYFLFGGMAGGFLLFGLSLVYGTTGAIEFRGIAAGLRGHALSPLLLAGLVMVMVGLGFKVAAVPFHFWAPDAYQGAPTPAAGFIAAGSKVAAFFILAKFAGMGLPAAAGSAAWGQFQSGWVPLLAIMAALSMVWGNIAALAQRNVKRLLAYSAVAHGGYTLVAVIAGGPDSLTSVLFYAATYAFTALGAFGVVGLVERGAGGAGFEHFRGLGRRSPGLAVCFAVFILSLAGIPPLAGFFGKFYLFIAALRSPMALDLGLLWLVTTGALTTCISFYYYLRVLKVVFVDEPEADAAAWPAGGLEYAAVVVAALAVVVAGCAPALLLQPLRQALAVVGW